MDRICLLLVVVLCALSSHAQTQANDWNLGGPKRGSRRAFGAVDKSAVTTPGASSRSDTHVDEYVAAEAAMVRGDAVAARELWPNNSAAGQLLLARRMADHNLLQPALEVYRQVLERPRSAAFERAPLLIEIARLELQVGDHEAALSHLQQAEQRGGMDTGLSSELWALRYEAQRALGQLADYVKAAQRVRLRDASHQRRLAQAYESLGNLEAAILALKRAAALQPGARENLRDLISLLLRAGDESGALLAYSRWLARFPQDIDAHIERARLRWQMGQRLEALADLRRSVENARDEDGLHRLHAELVDLGDDKGAERAVARLLQRWPSDHEASLLLAQHKLRSGDRTTALSLVGRAVTQARDRAAAHQQAALLLTDHGLHVDACVHYEAVFKLRPEDPDAEQALAAALPRCHRGSEALSHYDNLLHRADTTSVQRRLARRDMVTLWAALGDLQTEMLRLERHLGFDRRTLAFDPKVKPDLEPARMLAEVYMHWLRHPSQGTADYSAATEAVLSRLEELDPQATDTLLALERLRVARNDEVGAIEVLQKLLQTDPDNAGNYLRRLSERSQALYRDDDALRFAQQHVEVAPSDAAALMRLGQLQEARGAVDAACSTYERVLVLDQDHHTARWRLVQLLVFFDRVPEGQRQLQVLLGELEDPVLFLNASQLATQLAARHGALAEVERVLLRRTTLQPTQAHLRKALLQLYGTEFGSSLLDAGSLPTPARSERALAVSRVSLRPMLDALASGDREEQGLSLALLQRLAPSGAAPALLAFAQRSQMMELRRAALVALLPIAAPAQAQGLLQLATGPELRLRVLAAYGLLTLAFRRPSATLPDLRSLTQSATPAVRCYGALALPGGGQPTWPQVASELLERDESALVRSCAAQALSRPWPSSGAGRRVPIEASWLATQLAAAASRHGGPERGVMLAGLSTLSSPQALQVLARWTVRGAPWLISRMTNPSSGDTQEPSLPAPGFGMREFLRFAQRSAETVVADRIGFAKALEEALIRALEDSVEQRVTAMRLLLHAGLPPNMHEQDALEQAVVEQLQHPDPTVRVLAVQWLAADAPSWAFPQLAQALGDSSLQVRRAALEAMLRKGGPNQESPVPSALEQAARHEEHWPTRLLAVSLLAKLGLAAEAMLLQTIREDAQAWIRKAAIDGLVRPLTPFAAAALVDAVRKDADVAVQTAAARALRTSGVEVGFLLLDPRLPAPVRKVLAPKD